MPKFHKKLQKTSCRLGNFKNGQHLNHLQGHFNGFNYYNSKRKYARKRNRGPPKRAKSRSPSPFNGTEEYNQKKIQEASDMIKKRLLMTEDTLDSLQRNSKDEEVTQQCNKLVSGTSEKISLISNDKPQKKVVAYNVEEIYEKIINHISKLNYGKKMNLIRSNSSGYDIAIQQIQKQKRLELSKAFREMCTNQSQGNSEVINSLIPDISIKIEDLPLEVIRELSSSLDLEYDFHNKIEIKQEPIDGKTEKTSSTQTVVDCLNVQTQTENFTENVDSLDTAITVMDKIDAEIERLTQLRRNIFVNLQKKNHVNLDTVINEKGSLYEKPLEFSVLNEKILVITLIEDTILVGTDRGNILCFNKTDGTTVEQINVTQVPITALCYLKDRTHFLVASTEAILYEYSYETKRLIKRHNVVDDYVQCMEQAWKFVFLGTARGKLLRYCSKAQKIEFEEAISLDGVMVLKATQEGARRVLLVGTRNASVCVRDAMSGLHLRMMTALVTPSVYSLLLVNSLVFCGTTSHDLLVFNFNSGELINTLQVGSKGISCMKLVDNLLFASSYNGNIYVFNIKSQKFVGVLEGPGGTILSMEIVKNLVIISTIFSKFTSILIPDCFLHNNFI